MHTLRQVKCLAAIGVTVLFLFTPRLLADSGPSANGHGNLVIAGELRTFSFTAVTQKGGVTGEAQLDNRAQGVRLHLVINCLVVTGNVAKVSGIVTKVTGPTIIQVGWPSIFYVNDNGEGSNSPPDTISLVFSFDPSVTVDCRTPFVLDMLAIDDGNIQVKP